VNAMIASENRAERAVRWVSFIGGSTLRSWHYKDFIVRAAISSG
jgi:hypothetical protein